MSMPRVSLARYFWGAEADGALAIQTWSGEARYINEPWSINAHRHMDADPAAHDADQTATEKDRTAGIRKDRNAATATMGTTCKRYPWLKTSSLYK